MMQHKHIDERVSNITVKEPALAPETLLQEWRRMLPELLPPGDGCEVHLENLPYSLFVHIDVSGHGMYSFDFRVNYLDNREVKVELLDVQKGSEHIDERQEEVQQLLQVYIRHIHECAQQLKPVTSP